MIEPPPPPKLCTECRALIRPGALFCGSCGALVQPPKICPSCGKQNNLAARFCGGCAATLEVEQGADKQDATESEENSVKILEPLAPPPLSSGDTAEAVTVAATAQHAADRAPTFAFQDPLTTVKTFARENPYLAAGGTAVVAAVLLLIGGLAFLAFGNRTSATTEGGSQSTIGTASGRQYATRLTHIRNGPTSIGTTIVSDVQAGESVSGTWVLGRDGATKWLRFVRPDGSIGFLWGNNLSPAPPSRAVSSRIGDFSAYPAPLYTGGLASPDFRNSPASFRRFRTVIREGVARGINFGGHYSIITIGCGTDCSSTIVVDDQSGAIFDFPLGGEVYYALNLAYRPDSLLIVAQWQDNLTSSPACVREDLLLVGTSFNVLHQQRLSGSCPP